MPISQELLRQKGRGPITFILAGNYRQFQNYMRAKKLFPTTTQYLDKASDLLNYTLPSVVRIGTWYTRPDLPAIERAIQNHGGKVFDDPFEGMS